MVIDGAVERWLDYRRTRAIDTLDELLGDSVTYHSPIRPDPITGKELARRFIIVAITVLPDPDPDNPNPHDQIRYTKKLTVGDTAMLEFEGDLHGTHQRCAGPPQQRRRAHRGVPALRTPTGCAEGPRTPRQSRVRRPLTRPTSPPAYLRPAQRPASDEMDASSFADRRATCELRDGMHSVYGHPTPDRLP